MKRQLLCCAMLLALAACASHPPRCDGRLTPINRPSLNAREIAGAAPIAALAPKQARR
ncbi:MAG: hypothetical protein HIU85_14200 [Proteobacteria bacterium]|nr:hypothetical protein [Pseudomonadota bacterium]